MNANDLLQRGDGLRKSRDFLGAVPIYLQALQLGGDGRATLGLADAYRGMGETEKVIEVLKPYVARHPGNAAAHARLADAYKKARQRDLALEHYARSLALDPRNRGALSGLGDLHHREDQPALALACWEPLLDMHPGLTAIQVKAGNLHLRAQAFDRAAHRFRAALVQDPVNPEAIFGLADSLRGLGRFAEARPLWEEVLAADPLNRQALTRAGDCYAGLGDLDRAQELFERSLALGFDKAALLGLAQIQCGVGEFKDALQLCGQILQRHPGDARTLEFADATRARLEASRHTEVP
jgi:tetratricopeptide (TPR) repeat protein